MDNIYNLTKSFYHVCNIFNTHNITYWIDWGTALGHVRNNSLIPWDYDIDICVLDTDYEKMIEIFNDKNNEFELICDVNFYEDPGCCVLYLKELYSPEMRYDCMVIDIVKYKIDKENNKVKSEMTKKTILEYSNPMQNMDLYNFNYDDVFPLQKVIVNGIITFAPNKVINLMDKYYGEGCKDNYEKLEEYNIWKNKITNYQKFLGCSYKAIQKFKTMNDGIEYFKKTKAPFIVFNPNEFENVTYDVVKQSLLNEEKAFAYKNSEWEYNYKDGKEYLKEWESGTTIYNMVDTPVSNCDFFPEILKKNNTKIREDKNNYGFCYNLTKQNNFTKYHIDPPYGDGWMYLCTGTKLWYIISKEDTEYILNNGYTYKDIEKMKFYEIIKILNWYLYGKIYVGTIESKDFVYFGENCFHSVITYDKTIGICGYAYLE
jgi:phosphorylcholine metabolism protein LicD